jgi:protein-serine/threonine kinase
MLDVADAPSTRRRNKSNKGNQPSASGSPTSENPPALLKQNELTDPPPEGTPLSRPVTAPNLLVMASNLQSNSPASSRNTSDKSFTMRKKAATDLGSSSTAAQTVNPREGFMKRVGSYLKKGRTGNSPPRNINAGTDVAVARANPTFSISSTSPNTSASPTPPSPGSRESTFIESESAYAPDHLTPITSEPAISGHGHSSSMSNVRSPSPRMGITWGPNFTDEGHEVNQPPKMRRRSISQDQFSFFRGLRKEEGDVLQLETKPSMASVEGTGAKARRLSTALPHEFYVSYVELDTEFRNSSHVPGRRGQTVGKGATATVKLMFRKDDHSQTYYAVKEYRKPFKDEDPQDYVMKVKSEYSIAQSLHHPNIVRSIRLCTYHGRWNHVMEFCQYGELYQWVDKGLFRNGTFKLNDRLCFFKQLIRGVDYLHNHGIAHRDIKLENLLLNEEGCLKITDFGVSEVFSGQHPGLIASGGLCGTEMGEIRKCAPGICGSMPYIAPEVIEGGSEFLSIPR